MCMPMTKLFSKIKISKIVKNYVSTLKQFTRFTLSRLRGGSFTGDYHPREYGFAAVLVSLKLGLFPEIESEFRESGRSLHPPKKEYVSVKGFKYAKRIGR